MFRFSEEQLVWIKAELGPLLDFYEYNVGDTAFFPDVASNADQPKFKQLNAEVLARTLAKGSSPVAINGDVNIRSVTHSEPCDIPEGHTDRGLPNFNFLIDQVSVRDSFQSKV